GGRAHLVRRRYQFPLPSRCALRRQDLERCETRRYPGRAAHDIRAWHQHEDSQGARPRYSAVGPVAGGSTNRMMNRRALVAGRCASRAEWRGFDSGAMRRCCLLLRKEGAMRLLMGLLTVALVMPTVVAAETAGENGKKKNISRPVPATPVANYVPAVQTGSLLFLSGAGPASSEPRGKVGKDLTLDQGYEAARSTCLNLLAATRAALGSLDKVKRVVKVLGMVNSSPGFTDQPKVINGCSDLLVEVFGEAVGKHARSAVGMAELPFNIPVEVEMIVEVETR